MERRLPPRQTTRVTKTGLRTVDLVREKDEWGESFAIAVNGRQIFARGANWIPTDAFSDRATPERVRCGFRGKLDFGEWRSCKERSFDYLVYS